MRVCAREVTTAVHQEALHVQDSALFPKGTTRDGFGMRIKSLFGQRLCKCIADTDRGGAADYVDPSVAACYLGQDPADISRGAKVWCRF